jgi:hypothetical protein
LTLVAVAPQVGVQVTVGLPQEGLHNTVRLVTPTSSVAVPCTVILDAVVVPGGVVMVTTGKVSPPPVPSRRATAEPLLMPLAGSVIVNVAPDGVAMEAPVK